MGSFTDLNTYSNQTLSFTDLRLPNVILSVPDVSNITSIISTNVFSVQLSTNIIDIIRPVYADVKYIIDVTAVAGTTVNFGTLPAGVSVVESPSGVYTVNGIDSVSDWDAVKTPTITVPGTFSGSFFYDVTIRYNNLNGQQNLTYTVGRFIPISVLTGVFNFAIGTSNVLRNEALLPGVFSQTSDFQRIKSLSSTLASTTSLSAAISKFVGFAALEFGQFTQDTTANFTVSSGVKNKILPSTFSRFFSVNYISYFEPTEFASTANITKALTGFRQFGDSNLTSTFTQPTINGDTARIRFGDTTMSTNSTFSVDGEVRPGLIETLPMVADLSTDGIIQPGLHATVQSEFSLSIEPQVVLVSGSDMTASASISAELTGAPLTLVVTPTTNLTQEIYLNGASNFDIDWGDGTTETVSSGTHSHTYPSSADYNLTVDSTSAFHFKAPTRTTSCLVFPYIGLTSLEETFKGCSFSPAPAFQVPKVLPSNSSITSMKSVFEGVSDLDRDISLWNTSGVTDMSFAFKGCGDFNADISSWNTSSVTTMESMLESANDFAQDISSWNVANVTTFKNAFVSTKIYGNYNSWSVANVTNMNSMFRGCVDLNSSLNSWNTANVTDMGSMFEDCVRFRGTISSWDTSSVTDMSKMFKDTSLLSFSGGVYSIVSTFNSDITSWNTSSVTTMEEMFMGCFEFNQNIGSWNTANVTNMDRMFHAFFDFGDGTTDQGIFDQDISGWCVELIASKPTGFDLGQTSTWVDSEKPDWGVAC